MAFEGTKVELYGENSAGDPRRYTCASGTKIVKYTLLALTDPRTATAHASVGQKFAGIAAMEKSATDYSTSVSAWTNGIFSIQASGAITVGQAVTLGPVANTVIAANVGATVSSGAVVVGYALDTETNAKVRVRIGI